MTADRIEIRRDIDNVTGTAFGPNDHTNPKVTLRFADNCFLLLTELEKVERERDDAMAHAEKERALRAEETLAKVHALVEAVRAACDEILDNWK